MAGDISLSIGELQGRFGDTGALDFARDIGLRCVDFDLTRYDCAKEGSLYAADMDTVAAHFRQVRTHADALGIRIGQTHGRIRGYRLDEEWNEKEYRGFCRDVLATSILGAPYCVVHGVHLGLDAAPEDQRSLNRRMFRDFLPEAKRYGVMTAAETLGDTHAPDGRDGIDFFGDIDEFLRADREIRAENPDCAHLLCTCMDTGHTNKAARFGRPLPADFIRMIGPSVRCLHLNDNDMQTDQHKVPLSGTIDWTDVMAALCEIGYAGDYNMELSLKHFGRSTETIRAYAILAVRVMEELRNG